MFRTVLCTVCLLAGLCQASYSQGRIVSEPKSAGTATKYSACGTIIPIVAAGALVLAPKSDHHAFGEGWDFVGIIIGTVGIVGGPGFGHAYTGRWGQLAKGSVFRAVGAAFIISGLVGSDPSGMSGWGDSDEEENENKSNGAAELCIGGAIYLWSTIHDFRTLGRSVEQYNQKHAGITVSVSPTYFASENAPGVIVSLGF